MLRKGADKGKGKGNGKSGISELSWSYQAPWGAPLGQVQAAQDQYQSADVSQWLVPICAVTKTTADQWNTIKNGAKMLRMDNKPKIQCATRFAALACDEGEFDWFGSVRSEFPDLVVAAKTASTSVKMPKWIDNKTQKDKKKRKKEVLDEFGEPLGRTSKL